MTFGFAMRALRRHIILILVTVIVVTGAGVALGNYLAKTYTSRAQILLGLDIQGSNMDPQTANLYLRDRAMTYAQLVSADEVIVPVASAFNLDAQDLRENVVAVIVPETVVLELAVTDATREQAVALTQAVTDRFMGQVSTLNVKTGGPAVLPAQLSVPQQAAIPDQLHGNTLIAVSALVGIVIGVLLALLVAVVKANRAARRSTPKRPDDDPGTGSRHEPFPPTSNVNPDDLLQTLNDHRRDHAPLVTTGATNGAAARNRARRAPGS